MDIIDIIISVASRKNWINFLRFREIEVLRLVMYEEEMKEIENRAIYGLNTTYM